MKNYANARFTDPAWKLRELVNDYIVAEWKAKNCSWMLNPHHGY